jgi:hypothetical protein
MVIDWSSLSYHALYASQGVESRWQNDSLARPDEIDPEDQARQELVRYNNTVMSFLLDIIERINPLDVVIACEGSHGWRFDYLEKYYLENTTVYYDSEAYYVQYDNILAKVTKTEATPLHPVKDIGILTGLKFRKLCEMPQRVIDLLKGTQMLTKTGKYKSLLPKYKGHRASSEWDFAVPKDVWRNHKDALATYIGQAFRALVVNVDGTEGDDAVYCAYDALHDEYESTIIVTADGDMTQMLSRPDVCIYNHRTKMFVECMNPKAFLECKILSGDTSDDINGMALPGKATKLGDAGAAKLASTCDDIIKKATEENWINQYLRNVNMIDFTYIPTSVSATIKMAATQDLPKDVFDAGLYGLGIDGHTLYKMEELRKRHYHTLVSREVGLTTPAQLTNLALNVEDVPSEVNAAMQPTRTFAWG